MRPTDENQASSRRPDLMSPTRRTGADINILALLDGQPARSRTRRLRLRPAMVCYGVAALLATVLVGTLGWLAYDVGNAVPAAPVAAAAAPAVQAPPLPAAVPTRIPEAALAAELTAAPAPAIQSPPPPPRQPAARLPATPKPAPHPPAPRHPVTTPKNRPSVPPMDTDVAWIAAILRHEANAREAEASSR